MGMDVVNSVLIKYSTKIMIVFTVSEKVQLGHAIIIFQTVSGQKLWSANPGCKNLDEMIPVDSGLDINCKINKGQLICNLDCPDGTFFMGKDGKMSRQYS